MKKIRQTIRQALKGAERPVVLTSFGKDSTLLLALAREVVPTIDCLWFRSATPHPFALSLIGAWDLTVYSYAPTDVQFIPSGDGVTVVSDFSVSGLPLPVLQDVDEGERCSLKLFPKRTPYFEFPWDVALWAVKDSDSHPTLDDLNLVGDFQFGKVKFVAPLWEMSDLEVWKAIKTLGVPYDEERYDREGADPDSIRACTKCFNSQTATVYCPEAQREIPASAWDKQASLAAFRARFNAA